MWTCQRRERVALLAGGGAATSTDALLRVTTLRQEAMWRLARRASRGCTAAWHGGDRCVRSATRLVRRAPHFLHATQIRPDQEAYERAGGKGRCLEAAVSSPCEHCSGRRSGLAASAGCRLWGGLCGRLRRPAAACPARRHNRLLPHLATSESHALCTHL